MQRQLGGMVVVITGASAGIGRAVAKALSGRGVRLVLAARRCDRLKEVASEVGGDVLCVRADVSVQGDCEALIRTTVERFGRVDTLICNAGYGLIRTVHVTSAEEMRKIFETNVFGTTDCIRAAVPVMEGQELRDGCRGQVMIISSAAARRGLPYFGAYSATKAAQLSLAESMRVELKPKKIAVTSVHPVGTTTDFFAQAESSSGTALPVGGFGEKHQTAEWVAAAIVRGIERPKPEVWPMRPARWGLSGATLMPGTADRVLGHFFRKIVQTNAGKNGNGNGDGNGHSGKH